MKKNLAITGGSTGGHITPLIAFVNFLQENNDLKEECNHIIWIGEKGSLEEKAAKSISNVVFLPIISGKRRRYRGDGAWWKNIRDLGRICIGIRQAWYYIIVYKIDIVFGKGGYVSLPLCIAAKILGKKVYIHESDIHPGLANRSIFPFADAVFSGFPLSHKKAMYVGQLLSLTFLESLGKDGVQHTSNNAHQKDHQNEGKIPRNISEYTKTTNVLVLGGSQGSSMIFDAVRAYCEHHDKKTLQNTNSFHFFITLGTKNAHYKNIFNQRQSLVTTFEYLDARQMASLYELGDLALTRGGATSLAEQKLFGIHSAIIPLPYTGGNHQYYNACWYRDTYNDILILQDEKMIEAIHQFLQKNQGYKKTKTTINKDILSKPYTTIAATIFGKEKNP